MSTMMMLTSRFALCVLVAFLATNMTWGRKTPGGRTALGVSRSNSLRKPIRLAGPGVSVNPRQEELEKAKEKTMRKLQRQQAALAAGTPLVTPKRKRGTKKQPIQEEEKEDEVEEDANAVDAADATEGGGEEKEHDSFELDTVEQEVQRSKGALSRAKRPLLGLLLQKRRKLATREDD